MKETILNINMTVLIKSFDSIDAVQVIRDMSCESQTKGATITAF